MKKSLVTKSFLAAGVVGLAIAGSTASAGLSDFKFYAGAGLDYGMNSYDSSTKDKLAVDKIKGDGLGVLVPVLGMKFHDNFGVEFGYSFNKKITLKSKDTRRSDSTLKNKNMYVDLVGFMPVMDQMDLLGGIGIGKFTSKKSENFRDVFEIKNRFSWRVKFGAQYNFTSNFGVRAMATYQDVGNKLKDNTKNVEDKLVKNVKTLGLSLIYTF